MQDRLGFPPERTDAHLSQGEAVPTARQWAQYDRDQADSAVLGETMANPACRRTDAGDDSFPAAHVTCRLHRRLPAPCGVPLGGAVEVMAALHLFRRLSAVRDAFIVWW